MKIVTAKNAFTMCVITLLFIQGCATVLNSRIEKGPFVKEEPTGRGTIEIGRRPKIDLMTPTSVSVYDAVQYGDEYRQIYKKIMAETITDLNPNYIHLGRDYCARVENGRKPSNYDDICRNRRTTNHILENEYINEISFKNIVTKKESVSSGKVNAVINDNSSIDLVIQTNGKAEVHLDDIFDVLPLEENVKIKFVYGNESTTSEIRWADAELAAKKALPLYRSRGDENNSFRDYFMAYKVTGLPSDYEKAVSLARTSNEKEQLEKTYYYEAKRANSITAYNKYIKNYPSGIFVADVKKVVDEMEYHDATKSGKLAEFIKQHPNSSYIPDAKEALAEIEYDAFKKKACKGKIGSAKDLMYENPYSTEGKCYLIQTAPFEHDRQYLDRSTALFFLSEWTDGRDSRPVWINYGEKPLPSDCTAWFVGIGVLEYKDVSGALRTIPKLKVIKIRAENELRRRVEKEMWGDSALIDRRTKKDAPPECGQQVSSLHHLVADNPYETEGKCYFIYSPWLVDRQLLDRSRALYTTHRAYGRARVLIDFDKRDAPAEEQINASVSWNAYVMGMGAFQYESAAGKLMTVPTVKVIKILEGKK